MRTFIAASKEAAETSYLTRSKLAQWRLLALACVFAAVLAAGLAAWWQQEWLKEQLYALPNARTLRTTQEVALEEKDTFKECSDCPEMIPDALGNFTMGSPNNEKDRNETEGPQHEVTIANPFAVSKFELTFDEWDACVTHGDCSPNVGDSGWGRGRRPLANVSWDDAKTYVAWLSRITGRKYRLLSEAEFEYAARSRTHTAYPWGDDIQLNGIAMANCSGCGSQWDAKRTAPFASFAPNQFGLYDMVGNVWEWVEDCRLDNDKSSAGRWLGVDRKRPLPLPIRLRLAAPFS